MNIQVREEELRKEAENLLKNKERTVQIMNQIDTRLLEIQGSLKILEEMKNESKKSKENEDNETK